MWGQVLHLTSSECGLVQIRVCHHSSQQTGIQQTGGEEEEEEEEEGLSLLKVNIPETITAVKFGGCMVVRCAWLNFR